MALLTTKLLVDYHVTGAITSGDGRIYQLNDQHQLLNNDGLGPFNATQTGFNFRPYLKIDIDGNSGIEFPWGIIGYQSGIPNTYLDIPTSLTGFNSQSYSLYAVASYIYTPAVVKSTIFAAYPSTANFNMGINIPVGNRPTFFCNNINSNIHGPVNKGVYVFVGRSANSVLGFNNDLFTGAAQAATNACSGGVIANNNVSNLFPFMGAIYRLALYGTGHSESEITQNVNFLINDNNITPNFNEQIVCRGTSLTEGVGATGLNTYAYSLHKYIKNKRIISIGNAGYQIGTTGINPSMRFLDASALDPIFDNRLPKNSLFIDVGGNDIVNTGLVQECYDRLTGYCYDRTTGINKWQVNVLTLPTGNYLHSDIIHTYNNLIRTGLGLGVYYSGVFDVGTKSSSENRFDNFNDTTYFYSDKVHLTSSGYNIWAYDIYNNYLLTSNSSSIITNTSFNTYGDSNFNQFLLNNNLGIYSK